jgi:hypothetical protein
MGVHSQFFFGENNLEGVQKPSQNDNLQINATCIKMPSWRNQSKIQNPSMVHILIRKMGWSYLIHDVK